MGRKCQVLTHPPCHGWTLHASHIIHWMSFSTPVSKVKALEPIWKNVQVKVWLFPHVCLAKHEDYFWNHHLGGLFNWTGWLAKNAKTSDAKWPAWKNVTSPFCSSTAKRYTLSPAMIERLPPSSDIHVAKASLTQCEQRLVRWWVTVHHETCWRCARNHISRAVQLRHERVNLVALEVGTEGVFVVQVGHRRCDGYAAAADLLQLGQLVIIPLWPQMLNVCHCKGGLPVQRVIWTQDRMKTHHSLNGGMVRKFSPRVSITPRKSNMEPENDDLHTWISSCRGPSFSSTTSPRKHQTAP